jgi:hypothetical protein
MEAGGLRAAGGWPPIEICDCVAPPSGAHPKVKQALLMSVSNATITVQDEPAREPSSFDTSITLSREGGRPAPATPFVEMCWTRWYCATVGENG